jgi:hypothetical protein
MTESNSSGKEETEKPQTYVRTCREGAVAANIFRRTAASGLEYLDFSLSRAWKTPNGEEGYSQNFFSKNREAIHVVVDQACEFIAHSDQDALVDTKEAA